MKYPSRPEPPLEELPLLRRTSQSELPPPRLRAEVLARLRTSLSEKRGTPLVPTFSRTLAIAALVLLVPAAFAATPVGAPWWAQLNEWVGRWTTPSVAESPDLQPRPKTPPSETRAAPDTEGPKSSPPPDAAHSSDPSGAVQLRGSTTIAPSTPPRAPHRAPGGVSDRTGPPIGLSPLEAERRLLEQARLELAAGRPHQALELTQRHAELFPQGALLRERIAIERQGRTELAIGGKR